MKEKRLENARICPKGDIEANWNKAIGYVPKDKEIIIYKADAAHPIARFKIGDGVTVVQDLNFSGADMVAIEKLVNEKGELLIEYVDNAVDTIIQILDNKLDKSGGTVGGDLSVQGNLNVVGTTTTKDTETILVKDNIIVANSDGNELLEEAGFAVKTGAAAAYGIMYDQVGDGVKIGLGAFDKNGKFKYTEGEDQFLATRDDEIADGSLVKWDDTEKKLVDAGNDYIKNTDYASEKNVGVVKTSQAHGTVMDVGGVIKTAPATPATIALKSSSHQPIVPKYLDYAVNSALADCKDTSLWTDDSTDESGETIKGTKTKARETLGAVGFEDMAVINKAGVVKKAADHEIRRAAYNHYVDAYYLSFGIKYFLTTPSAIPTIYAWTEDDKTKACETIGAVKKIEDKYNSGELNKNQVYTTRKSNVTNDYSLFVDGYHMTTAWAIPVRGPHGSLNVPDYDSTKDYGAIPEGQIAVNKNYVEDNFIPKLPGIVGCASAVVQRSPSDGGGYENIALASYAKQALYGRIARYQNPAWEGDTPADNMGMLVTNIPTKNYHCANKKYVDDLINSKIYRIVIDIGMSRGTSSDISVLYPSTLAIIQKLTTKPVYRNDVFAHYDTSDLTPDNPSKTIELPTDCYITLYNEETSEIVEVVEVKKLNISKTFGYGASILYSFRNREGREVATFSPNTSEYPKVEVISVTEISY